MSRLRFNHVFVGLMGLCLLSAFVLPARATDPLRSTVQGLFFPVSRPSRSIATWFVGKFEKSTDARPDKDLRFENERLRASLAQLTAQVESLQKLAADRRQLGDIAELCIPARVMGTDPGGRDSLSLNGTFGSSLVGKPVLNLGGIVGRIDRAGLTGAQVRLITDPGFRTAARFQRLADDGSGFIRPVTIETNSVLVEGVGNGRMAIYNLQMKEATDAQIAAGDAVVLDDPDWPALLRYRELGQVVSVRPRGDAPLLAEIIVQPRRNLLALQDVMVMVREDAGFRQEGLEPRRAEGPVRAKVGPPTATVTDP
jgi:cell shape-determining protein MreC